jgi:hypothetical protein
MLVNVRGGRCVLANVWPTGAAVCRNGHSVLYCFVCPCSNRSSVHVAPRSVMPIEVFMIVFVPKLR